VEADFRKKVLLVPLTFTNTIPNLANSLMRKAKLLSQEGSQWGFNFYCDSY